jgi:hypothetical protein
LVVTASSPSLEWPKWPRWKLPEVPSPDTSEGRLVILGVLVAAVYVLLLLADNTALADQAGAFVPLLLVLGTVIMFSIGGMLGADEARQRHFELELARTVAVHSGAGQLPEPDTPLGRVLVEYLRSAEETREHGRIHAYAAGPALYGAAAALGAAIFWGIGLATGTIWLGYLAVVVELPAMVLLAFSVAMLANGSRRVRTTAGFTVLTPHRWRQHETRSSALDEALTTLPWLKEAAETMVAPRRATTALAPISAGAADAQP